MKIIHWPYCVFIQTHEAHQTRISQFIRQISNTNLPAHNAVTIWHCGPQTPADLWLLTTTASPSLGFQIF